ncbi:O-acetylhomoserine aminocarboxypropyltransferase [Massilia sp. W12]|uniref:O-acetylhomoserine aminocarboxypropyltransferase n=1 Tax=Massilia sp. W12 TaxID=3126507 RepID=UPI0030CCF5E9
MSAGFDTLALHAGSAVDSATGARATPIYFTTSFCFDDAAHAASLFNMERAGHVYSRLSNPTNATLEEKIAALECGIGALACASGQAALFLAICTIAPAGSHILASRSLYGGSHNLLAYTLPRFGIQTSFVDMRDVAAVEAAIRPETRLLFGESIGNPMLDVLNIPAIAAIAHAHALPLLVDATLATPWLQQPLQLGADLVLHSASKYLCGHGTAIGGLLVDGGQFDWQAAHAQHGHFAELCQPYAGFHDVVFCEESALAAFLLRARREGLRDFGACLSPHNAFAILQGVETLSLRMQRHVENTRALLAMLAQHPAVAALHHPELPGHPDAALAQQLLPRGGGAVISVEVKGGKAAAQKMIEHLRLFSHLANVGDAKSLALHPASTTHARMREEDLQAAGIAPGMVRLSIGLEDAADLQEDLNRALKLSQK